MFRISYGGGGVMASISGELIAELPDTFRYSEALEHISERQLRRLIAEGQITALSRGLYRKSGWLGDDDLIEIASKSPRATLCLRSALAKHDLIDDIPAVSDIAIPRGRRIVGTSVSRCGGQFGVGTADRGGERYDIRAGPN